MRARPRIRSILARIEKIWAQHPDLRLGQIIVNVESSASFLFHVEDDKLIEMIEDWGEKHEGAFVRPTKTYLKK